LQHANINDYSGGDNIGDAISNWQSSPQLPVCNLAFMLFSIAVRNVDDGGGGGSGENVCRGCLT
jgi:hypothetical protein